MDHTVRKRTLYESCVNKSGGNWEGLTYRLINAAKMRNFIKYIAIYGNSLDCQQTTVNDIETALRKNKKFYTWKKKNPEAIQLGLSKGFIYLFSRINTEAGDVDTDIEKCLAEALSVTTDTTTGKKTIVD